MGAVEDVGVLVIAFVVTVGNAEVAVHLVLGVLQTDLVVAEDQVALVVRNGLGAGADQSEGLSAGEREDESWPLGSRLLGKGGLRIRSKEVILAASNYEHDVLLVIDVSMKVGLVKRVEAIEKMSTLDGKVIVDL